MSMANFQNYADFSKRMTAQVKAGPGWWQSLTDRLGRVRYKLTDLGRRGFERLGVTPKQSINSRDLVKYRDTTIANRKTISQTLSEQLKNGDISIDQWIYRNRTEIKSTYLRQYLRARGGRNLMTQRDWGILGHQLRNQYTYLNDFAKQIVDNPQWSDRYIAARLQMYYEASSEAHERARAESFGDVGRQLPQYPGDGRTQCLTNCKCFWDIQTDNTNWLCYWRLSPAEHCPDCVDNSSKWNPLVLPRQMVTNVSDVKSILAGLNDG